MPDKLLSIAIMISLIVGLYAAMVAAKGPTPPAADSRMPEPAAAKELPDGAIPPVEADGDFIIGPTHKRAPEMTVQQGVPQGAIHNFTTNSVDSKIYPGDAPIHSSRHKPFTGNEF